MQTLRTVLILGFLAGVLWRSTLDVDIYTTLALLLGAGVVLGIGRMRGLHDALLVVAMVLMVIIGVVRTEVAFQTYEDAQVYEEGELIETDGFVVSEPDVREHHTALTLRVTTDQGSTLRVLARVL